MEELQPRLDDLGSLGRSWGHGPLSAAGSESGASACAWRGVSVSVGSSGDGDARSAAAAARACDVMRLTSAPPLPVCYVGNLPEGVRESELHELFDKVRGRPGVKNAPHGAPRQTATRAAAGPPLALRQPLQSLLSAATQQYITPHGTTPHHSLAASAALTSRCPRGRRLLPSLSLRSPGAVDIDEVQIFCEQPGKQHRAPSAACDNKQLSHSVNLAASLRTSPHRDAVRLLSNCCGARPRVDSPFAPPLYSHNYQ